MLVSYQPNYVIHLCIAHWSSYTSVHRIVCMQFYLNIRDIPPYSWCISRSIQITQHCIWCRLLLCTPCMSNLPGGLLWLRWKIEREDAIDLAYSIYWAVEYSISKDQFQINHHYIIRTLKVMHQISKGYMIIWSIFTIFISYQRHILVFAVTE